MPARGMLSEQFSEPPQPSLELEAQIPTVRPEGNHIMPGNKAATEAGEPAGGFPQTLSPAWAVSFSGGGRKRAGCD